MDIQTNRLLLKKIEMSDLSQVTKLFQDPDVMRFSLEGPFPPERSRKILENMLLDEKKHGIGVFVVRHQETNEWMGLIGVAWDDKPCVAYRFFKKFWNQGFATEALQEFLHHLQSLFPQEKFYAYVQEGNIGSIKVSQKAGMKFLRKTTFHNEPVLEYVLEAKI